jgi:hypothetical protein
MTEQELKMMKKWVAKGIVFGLAFAWVLAAASARATETPSPKAVFVEKSWHFEEVLDGKQVVHDFVVKNEGDAPLEILKVQTS